MTPVRRNRGFLAAAEARALDALVPLVPRRITPDMLSALGLAGAVLAGLGFALVLRHPAFWFVAILGLLLNWLGDSLDGRLARHRGAARPCRGYLLDNGLDMLGFLAVAAGFAASGLVAPALAFLALALHFILVNLAAARLAVTGVLDLSAGPVGTTELRAIFAAGAAVLAFFPAEGLASPRQWLGVAGTPLDIACVAWVLAMAVTIVRTLRDDLRLGAEHDARAPGAEPPSREEARPFPAALPVAGGPVGGVGQLVGRQR